MAEETQRKLAIICSKGTLDMAYPGLVLANSALMSGIEVHMFFTFWGLDMISDKKMDSLKITPLGNPSMGMPNLVSVMPGMTAMATSMMKKEIEKMDFPPRARVLADDCGRGRSSVWVQDVRGHDETVQERPVRRG